MAITYITPYRQEAILNKVALTLNGTINATQTTLTLNDASALPANKTIRFRIENELVSCSDISSNVCTIVRGIEGTTGASHTDGTEVEIVLTPTGLETLLREHSYKGCFSHESTVCAAPDNRIISENGAILTTANFTWLNQGTATAANSSKGGIYLTTQNEAQWQWRGLLYPVPSTPYSVYVKMRFGHGYAIGSSGSTMLAGWHQSGTGEFEGLGLRPKDAVAFWRFTNVTTYSTNVDSAFNGYMLDHPMWVRLSDDGSVHQCQISFDGNNWTEYAADTWQAGSTSFLTADYLCFLASSNGSGIDDQVYHFDAIVIEEQ